MHVVWHLSPPLCCFDLIQSACELRPTPCMACRREISHANFEQTWCVHIWIFGQPSKAGLPLVWMPIVVVGTSKGNHLEPKNVTFEWHWCSQTISFWSTDNANSTGTPFAVLVTVTVGSNRPQQERLTQITTTNRQFYDASTVDCRRSHPFFSHQTRMSAGVDTCRLHRRAWEIFVVQCIVKPQSSCGHFCRH